MSSMHSESQSNEYLPGSDDESYERWRMDDETRSSYSSNSADSLSLPSHWPISPHYSSIGPSKERLYGYEHTIYGYFNQDDEEAQEMIAQIKAARQALKKEETSITTTTTTDDQQKTAPPQEGQSKPSKRRCTQCFDLIPRRELSVLYLIVLGIVTALVNTAIKVSLTYILNLRPFWLLIVKPLTAQFFLWLGHTLLFLGLAVFFTKIISEHAIGSGNPEMKAILSGVHLKQFLKLRTLFAKCLGLICARGSGCVIGEEGPRVHITSILANNLLRLRIFRKIAISPAFIQLMLGAGVACGLGVSLSSIIGGVLFSIEVTSTYYPIRNYWYAFTAALIGTVSFKVLSNLFFGNALLAPFLDIRLSSSDKDLNIYEVLIFIVLGLVMGVLGACFIWLNENLVRFRRKYENDWKILRPYPYTFVIAIITAVVTFPGVLGQFMSLSSFQAVEDLLREESLSFGYLPNTLNGDWTNVSIWYSLPLYGITQYCLLLLTLGVPVPAGLFIPFLATGAAFGRIVGEAVNIWIPNGVVSAGVYSLVGAAGMVAAVTQTISVAVVMFEMTGRLRHALPVFVGVIVAYLTSSRLSISIYDSLAQLKGLPYLPDLQDRNYIQVAKDLMDPNVPFLTMRTTLKKIKALLEEWSKLDDYRNQLIPIVHTADHKILIGTTTFDALQHLCISTILELRKERDARQKGIHGFTLTEQRRRRKIINIEHRLKSIVYGAPIQFLPMTPLAQIHIIFITFRLVNAFVTKNGVLLGVIRRSALLRAVQYVTPFQRKRKNVSKEQNEHK